jgi:MFS family permease
VIVFLIRVAIFLASAAAGLLVASLLLPQMTVTALGFVTAVLIFTVAQAILSPFITKLAVRHAPAFLGGIGLVSTFVALLLSTLFVGGLTINGIQTWILATLVVWLVTAVATWVLPIIFLKKRLAGQAEKPRAKRV